MFQISMETDYALRCALLLSAHPDEIFGAAKIAKLKNIPRPFLTKILQKLARAGIVNSLRGSKGGFRLAKTPEDLTVLDVIEAMEGEITVNRCVVDMKNCDLSSSCALCPVWNELREMIDTKLGAINFKKLTKMKLKSTRTDAEKA